MRYEWGDYTFEGTVTVECPAVEVMRWLVLPDRMGRWIAGLETVTLLDERPDVLGARTRVNFGGGNGSPGTFGGEIVELSERTLVRCYRPGFDADSYERSVRYEVGAAGAATRGATALTCSVRTSLLGQPSVLKRLPTRNEKTHLHRSLERLRLLAEGRQQLPIVRRIRDSGLLPQPL